MKKSLISAVVFLFSLSAMADVTGTEVLETKGTLGINGWVELRPTYLSEAGEFHTENEAGLGFGLGKNLTLAYVQEFRTTLFDPKANGTTGLNFSLYDGYLKLDKPSSNSIFSYEARVYVPTRPDTTALGFIGAVRNYAKVSIPLTRHLSFEAWETPIVYAYSAKGGTANDELVANPIFENQLKLSLNFSLLAGKLSVKLPLIHQWIRYQDFTSGAKFNDQWGHIVTFYPEAVYSVGPTTGIGVAYSSDNLVSSDFSNISASNGFKKGWFQVIFNQAI